MSTRLQRAKEATSKILGQAAGPYVVDAICDHGEGIYLVDQNGKKYIDFSGGAMVACIGHGDERVTQAVTEQMKKVSYFFRDFWVNERLCELSERLTRLSPPNLTHLQFTNSGSEATETAIKLAQQYHLERGKPEKFMTIGRWQSYHGMTLGALSVSGLTGRRHKFGQLLSWWPKIPAPLCNSKPSSTINAQSSPAFVYSPSVRIKLVPLKKSWVVPPLIIEKSAALWSQTMRLAPVKPALKSPTATASVVVPTLIWLAKIAP